MDLSKVLNTEIASAQRVLVEASSYADSSFLIHHFLSTCVREQSLTIFVKLENTFSHYQSVQNKLGNSALMANNEKLAVIDLLSEFAKNSGSDNENYDHILDQVIVRVKDLASKKQPNERLNIIVDDLSLAHLNGIDRVSLNRFLHKIGSVSEETRLFVGCKSFDSNRLFVNNLVRLCDIYILVDNLSLHSKDFNGQVTLFLCDLTHKIQFLLFFVYI
jgi:hypothetical protein